jgi:hypothetical protein
MNPRTWKEKKVFVGNKTISEPITAHKTHLTNPNESLWQSVIARPDSACIALAVNDSIKQSFVLSGVLDSVSYTPKSIKVQLPDGNTEILKLKGDMPWSKGESFELLKFVDINFDGYSDLQVFNNAGATNFSMTLTYMTRTKVVWFIQKNFQVVLLP